MKRFECARNRNEGYKHFAKLYTEAYKAGEKMRVKSPRRFMPCEEYSSFVDRHTSAYYVGVELYVMERPLLFVLTLTLSSKKAPLDGIAIGT